MQNHYVPAILSSMDALSTAISLHRIANAIRDHGQDSTEVASLLASCRKALDNAKKFSAGKPFVITPSQLDTTQPEDFGYGTDEWKKRWLEQKVHHKKKDVGHNLSCYRNLNPLVIARTHDIVTEFSQDNNRRCCFVKSNGMRCKKYYQGPVCEYHIRLVESVPRMNDRFADAIKNEKLAEAYIRHLSNPHRKSMEVELALQRAMLEALISRVEIGAELNKIPFELLAAITAMCEKITNTVDKMAGMETKLGMRLSLEQVTAIVYSVIDLVFKTCPNLEQAQLTAIADGVEKLPLLNTTSVVEEPMNGYGIHTTEGTKMTTDRDKFIDDGTVQKNAFTLAEVKEHRDMINAKFAPAQAEYKEKLANVQKVAERLGIDTKEIRE